MDKWINIDDELPEEGEDLIMTYNDLVLTGWYQERRFYYFDNEGTKEEQEGVYYWMKLPEPPRDN